MRTRSRWWWWAAGVPAAMALVALGAYQLALHRLQAGILDALGPHATVGEMDLSWRALELRDLRVRASATGWPTDEELHAKRIHVIPDLRSTLRGQWRVRQLTIDDAYVSVLRTRQGQLRVLPAWLEKAGNERQQTSAFANGLLRAAMAAPPASSAASGLTPVSPDMPDIHIEQVLLQNVKAGFFDASVQRPPHRIRFEQLNAELGPIVLPALTQAVHIDLRAQLQGPQRNGSITINGELTPATRDAKISTRLQGVDLIALRPYLLKLNDGGVRQGTLDMQLDATVQDQRLHAPGRMTLIDLELGTGRGVLDTIAGVPRRAVLAAMSEHGRIDMKFTLEGRIDDPSFSLNEQLAVRTAAGLAEALGVSLTGIAEGVGSVIKGLFGR